MPLITDLPASTSLATTDYLIKDTGSTTQKIAISNAYATASAPGLVSTGAQTFAGVKTFTSKPRYQTNNINYNLLPVIEKTVENNSSATLTFATNTRVMIVTNGFTTTARGVYIAITSSGNVSVTPVRDSTVMIPTVSGSNLVINNTSGYTGTVNVIVFNGSVS